MAVYYEGIPFRIPGSVLLGCPLCLRLPVIAVTEVNLARVPRALEGEVKGTVASRGAGKGGCGVKVAVKR